MRRALSSDAGFSLTEVLVALVLLGLVAIVTGGLVSSAVAGRDRAREVEDKVATFRDLVGFSALVTTTWAGSQVVPTDITAGGFVLTDRDNSPKRARISLQLSDGHRKLTANLGPNQNLSLDLRPFEFAAVEYLPRAPQTLTWQSADGLSGGRPMAARLRLTEQGRQWSVLLWLDTSRTLGLGQ